MNENVTISLYDANNIDELPWPKSQEALHAKTFILPFIKEGTKKFIQNVDVDFYALLVDNVVLPLTANNSNFNNSYVCSFYSQYIGYAKEAVAKIQNPFYRNTLYSLLKLFGKFIQVAQLDKILYINNWLISTNLHPELSQKQIETVKQFLTLKFPSYTLAFRSLNFHDTSFFAENLKNCGFDFLFSRKIHFLDTQDEKSTKSRMFKSDLKLLSDSNCVILKNEEIPLEHIPRLLSLYNSLYIEKYSKINPQMTEKMFELILTQKLFELRAIEKDGIIEGVMGFYHKQNTMTSPLFGYDTKKPGNDAYRIISTLLALEAKNQKMLLNQSSGAASYKTLRRATTHMEYQAIFSDHLPLKQKLAWKSLITVFNKIGIPIMNKLKL